MNMQKIAKIMLRRMSHDYIPIRAYTWNHSRSGWSSISSDQKEFIDCVNRQSTVFDVDEVVQQLETLIEDKCSESGDDWYTAQCLNEAVEIVKGGGVE